MDIKKIIKEYYKQLYAHKFDNLNKIDQFLERHNSHKKETIWKSQQTMAKVVGYHSHDYVTSYGKGEGILQMKLRSLISLTSNYSKGRYFWVDLA